MLFRSVDFSSEALEAAEKGLQRLTEAYNRLMKLQPSAASTVDVKGLREQCAEAMDDDLNTQLVIAALFDSAKAINTVHDGKGTISAEDLQELQNVWKTFVVDILGLRMEEEAAGANIEPYKGAVDLLLNMRLEAKRNKQWDVSDHIRNELTALGFTIKDSKDGFEWSL